jgi:hypothetical protein
LRFGASLGASALAATAACACAPFAAHAACANPTGGTERAFEHPRLFESAECKTNGVKVPFIAWGRISLENTTLGNLECVNLFYGYDSNETEPGGNSEKSKAYDEILQWNASGFLTSEMKEPLAKCKSTSGLETWATAERPLHGELGEAGNLNGASTERLVTTGVPGSFTGGIGTYGLGHWRGRHSTELPLGEGSRGTGTYHERPSLPWRGESEATENVRSGLEEFWLRTGIAATERAEVEAEEAAAGTPTELRTGCYPQPETERVTRHPGFGVTSEEFTALRPDPDGCVQINLIIPELGVETVFQGTVEPNVVRGTKSCLTASRAELQGTEERHGYHLESIFGPGFTANHHSESIPIKECGFAAQQFLTLRVLP